MQEKVFQPNCRTWDNPGDSLITCIIASNSFVCLFKNHLEIDDFLMKIVDKADPRLEFT